VCCTQQKILNEVNEYLSNIEKWIKDHQQSKMRDVAQITMKHPVVKNKQVKEEMKKYPAKIALTEVHCILLVNT